MASRVRATVMTVGLLASACAAGDDIPRAGLDAITSQSLTGHIQTLASDAFLGRGPSSPGEEKTIAYLREQFRALGLEPANGDSYYQEVPLVAITANPDARLVVRGRGTTTTLQYGGGFMAWTKRVAERASLESSEMVFVGYGIEAPEYDWHDYEGIDVRGKTVVILVNDPGFATQDTALFNGNAMTYYGRWTYKYEEAARQGAAGAIVVHETESAGYPWEVVQGSWSGEQFDLVRDDDNMSRVAVEGWVPGDTARALFRRAGHDYDSLKTRAATRAFEPVPLGLTASVTLRNTIRRSTSNNVLGVLRGAVRPEEVVIYVAHWDHLGQDTTLEGDQIYNGAKDNATGTAGLLELARAFTAVGRPPERSVLFLAVTAEEQGLLGSAYYATHPVFPTHQTVAVLNMDGLNTYGPMRDVTVIGHGNSELDTYLAQAAQTQTRVLRPDPEAEKGYYYRSDHFNFAKEGVPSLYTDEGIDHVDSGEVYGREMRRAYTAERYHKPSDEYDPSWDLRGAVDDLRLFFHVGYRLANDTTFPAWHEGTEFKAKREAELREAGRGAAGGP